MSPFDSPKSGGSSSSVRIGGGGGDCEGGTSAGSCALALAPHRAHALASKVERSDNSFAALLATLGNEGWELTAVDQERTNTAFVDGPKELDLVEGLPRMCWFYGSARRRPG